MSRRDRSLWLDTCPVSLDPRAALSGRVECDVAIVGAGFTGLWAAYYLAGLDASLRIVVLEREIAGFGASGRNGGWLQGGIAGSPSAYGLDSPSPALEVATRLTREAIGEVGRVVEEEGIECAYAKRGSFVVATNAAQWERLRSREAAAGDSGRELLSAAEVAARCGVQTALGGLFDPYAARVDPARLVRGLALACGRRGVAIYEETAAEAIGSSRIRTAGGEVVAGRVVLATEAYTTQLAGYKRRYLPLYSLMIATEPLSAATWEELGWDDGILICDAGQLIFYAQRTADGRIAIGGRGAPYRLRSPISSANERDTVVRARLEDVIATTFPAAAGAEITHHWGGPLAVPRDWSAAIVDDPRTGVMLAGGYTGHGVGMANVAGRTVASLVLGLDDEFVGMPWVGHRTRAWEPEPLRFLASRAIVAALEAADRREARGLPTRGLHLLGRILPPR